MAAQDDSDYIIKLEGGLGIRAHRESDAKAASRHLNNPNVLARLRNQIPVPYTEEAAAEWISFCRDPANLVRSGKWSAEEGSQGPALPPYYVIALDDEAIGGIGIVFGKDVYFRTGELGYWLSEDHWKKGFMTKLVPAFVDWVWKTFDILVRLNAEVAETNLGSAALVKKAGFEYEGRRPNMICKHGKLQTATFWGALRPE